MFSVIIIDGIFFTSCSMPRSSKNSKKCFPTFTLDWPVDSVVHVILLELNSPTIIGSEILSVGSILCKRFSISVKFGTPNMPTR